MDAKVRFAVERIVKEWKWRKDKLPFPGRD